MCYIKAMKKILLTGFEPFNEETMNPTQELLNLLQEQSFQFDLLTLELPTVFGEATDDTLAVIREWQPDAVVLLGQAGGRYKITPERVAINVMDASIADNEGVQPVDEPIRADGPAAYFSTLPIKEMVKKMVAEKIPAAVSNSAGTYVCNALMYGVLDGLAQEGIEIPAGFIHVPFAVEQVAGKGDVPALSLEDMTRALKICLNTLNESLTSEVA